MKYEYAYKQSDGTRHVETMTARNTDEVFATLRQKGIRPIKVALAKPEGILDHVAHFFASRSKIAIGLSTLSLILMCGFGAWLFWGDMYEGHTRIYSCDSPAFQDFRNHANMIRKTHKTAIDARSSKILRNYPLLAKKDGFDQMCAEISREKLVILNTREQVKSLFSPIMQVFADDHDALSAAQALYGEIMAQVDADEARVELDESAIYILDENRDKWRVTKGKMVFTDVSLRRDFEALLQEVNPANARFYKDFAPKSGE